MSQLEKDEAWVPAARFPRMFDLTSRSGEFGVTRDRLVPEEPWAAAEADLDRVTLDPADYITIIDMLETEADGELREMGVPASVMEAVDRLY